jgi:putative nucleotidyltransferase with HDIG domain
MTAAIFEQILNDHKELSSLPQTLSEVLRLVQDETTSATQMGQVIQRDPALTAKILRLVNSPYYGGREVASVSQAIMTVGIRAVTALALSSSIYDMTGKWQSTIDRKRFWSHSLQVAIASRDIADATGYAYPEEAFVCGLLHDIGILVLEKSFPEKYERVWKRVRAGESLCDREDEVWGTNHARVGQFLLEQWHLPQVICQAVGMHHNPMLTENDDVEFRSVRMVALANRIAQLTIVEQQPDLSNAPDVRSKLQENLELTSEQLADIEKGLMPKTVQEAAFLEIDVGSADGILMEANRMLYDSYQAVENLLQENRRMQQEIARAQMEKAALEALRTIAATFNHYINNASATILGRAQLIQVKMKQGEIVDLTGDIGKSMTTIVRGVNTVCQVLEELQDLTSFKTTVYHDDTFILDLEDRLKAKVEALEDQTEASTVG